MFYLYACLCTPCVPDAFSVQKRESIRFPGSGVTDGCEVPCGFRNRPQRVLTAASARATGLAGSHVLIVLLSRPDLLCGSRQQPWVLYAFQMCMYETRWNTVSKLRANFFGMESPSFLSVPHVVCIASMVIISCKLCHYCTITCWVSR